LATSTPEAEDGAFRSVTYETGATGDESLVYTGEELEALLTQPELMRDWRPFWDRLRMRKGLRPTSSEEMTPSDIQDMLVDKDFFGFFKLLFRKWILRRRTTTTTTTTTTAAQRAGGNGIMTTTTTPSANNAVVASDGVATDFLFPLLPRLPWFRLPFLAPFLKFRLVRPTAPPKVVTTTSTVATTSTTTGSNGSTTTTPFAESPATTTTSI